MGRHKMIKSPEMMWDLFLEYKKNLKPRMIQKATPRGVFTEEHMPPLTMEGFENYVADKGLNQSLNHYFSNLDGRYEDYVPVCSRIRREIRQDQIEGGMIGQYNASITQRLNALKEHTETVIKEQPLFPDELHPHESNK